MKSSKQRRGITLILPKQLNAASQSCLARNRIRAPTSAAITNGLRAKLVGDAKERVLTRS